MNKKVGQRIKLIILIIPLAALLIVMTAVLGSLESRSALIHQEKRDDSGYLYAGSGDEIPLFARIAGLADVLISWRSYKQPWTYEQALEHLVAERGRHFDPQLVDIFSAHFDEFHTLLQRLQGGSGA
ncbi:MAG: HD-GYP domain-containing protein [Spirochaeta sp.]